MLANYFAAAIRNLARNRFYAAISVLGLALGLAVAILTGLFVRHEFSYDRGLPDHERIFVASQVLTPAGHAEPILGYSTRADVAQLMRLDFPQMESVARVSARTVRILRAGNVSATEEDIAYADPGLLRILRYPTVAGDLSTALDRPDAVVLTRSLARKYFNRDDVVGQTLQMSAPASGAAPVNLRVTAVIEDLTGPYNLNVSALAAAVAADSPLAVADRGAVDPLGDQAVTFLKLRPDASAAQVAGELPAFAQRRIPKAPLAGAGLSFELTPLASLHLPESPVRQRGSIRKPGDPGLLMVAVALASLIVVAATLNFISLMTARSVRRALEVGVRKALGASRGAIIGQFLGETLLYVVMAMVLALAAVALLLPAMSALTLRELSAGDLTTPASLLALLGLAVVFTLGAGFYPALVLSSYRPAAVLKGGPVALSGSPLVRSGMVIIQFAVLIGLMVIVGVMFRQTSHTLQRNQAYNGDHVMLALTPGSCDPAFRERVLAVQGVQAASCSAGIEMTGGGAPVKGLDRHDRTVGLDAAAVDFGLLELHGIRPIAGRLLRREYGSDGALNTPGAAGSPSVVINESAARALGYPNPQAAVGKVLRWSRKVALADGVQGSRGLEPSEIVGVTPDFDLGLNREEIRPLIYYVDPALFTQLTARLAEGDVDRTLEGVDKAWRATGHLQPLERGMLSEMAQQLFKDLIILSLVISACVVLALFIGALGLFALAAYTTERRRKEMGIRKALGASTLDVGKLLLWQFTWPVLLASAVAWPLAGVGAQQWLNGFADRVDVPIWLFAASTATAMLIAWVTVGGQAWRVASAPPGPTLRYG